MRERGLIYFYIFFEEFWLHFAREKSLETTKKTKRVTQERRRKKKEQKKKKSVTNVTRFQKIHHTQQNSHTQEEEEKKFGGDSHSLFSLLGARARVRRISSRSSK
jgi:hypothetical protein